MEHYQLEQLRETGRITSKSSTEIKTFAADRFRTDRMFVKVYTDEGIDGVGEARLECKKKGCNG